MPLLDGVYQLHYTSARNGIYGRTCVPGDLGTPGWLLKLVIAFLSGRQMTVKYKWKYSRLFALPGGGPQGSLLGLFLFLVLIDDVGFEDQSNNAGELITKKKRVTDMNVIHLKYVDDLALAEAIYIIVTANPYTSGCKTSTR